jgi:predicted enzyme related to lactoylglutathione lyase
MSASRTYPHGATSWIDVEVGDLPSAQEFYGGLLGWTFEQVSPPGQPIAYVVAHLDGLEVAGLTGPTEPTPTDAAVWRTYVAVDDIDATCALVREAGGQVIGEPATAGEAGRWVNVLDPAEVEISLWQAGFRLGAQIANTPGAWNFSDLHAADPEASRAFYQRVFGWVFADLRQESTTIATMIQVPGYGDHLAATSDPDIHERQATAPPGFADVIGGLVPAGELGPQWHVTFTVADRDESAATAETLGATVLSRSEDDWTRKATIRDPQGAVFTASQFLGAPPS